MNDIDTTRITTLLRKLKPLNEANPKIRQFIERWKDENPGNDEELYSQLERLGLTELKGYLIWFPPNQMHNIKRISPQVYGNVNKAMVKYNRHQLGEVAIKKTNGPEVGIQLRLLLNVICGFANSKGYFTVPVLGLSKDAQGNLLMVMELAILGTLDKRKFEYDNWWQFAEMAYSLAVCLVRLHNEGLIHGNLHPGNIALTADITRPRLIDLEQSQAVEEVYRSSSHLPHPEYTPPEVREDYPSLTQASDVYTFAMILWQAIVGKAPTDDIISAFRDGDYPLPGPKAFFDILKDCWSSNPDDRPNSLEVCKLLREWRDQLAATLPKLWVFTKWKNILFTRLNKETKEYIKKTANEASSSRSSFDYPASCITVGSVVTLEESQEFAQESSQNILDEQAVQGMYNSCGCRVRLGANDVCVYCHEIYVFQDLQVVEVDVPPSDINTGQSEVTQSSGEPGRFRRNPFYFRIS
ncbi:kinase-like domain-containing protein [Jimgerdemannia flammicorona]|uniref:Kinase-like domain-containing protein n=1 Tax=Jimgerdemannia flammicorona TaxID=994334 RepID=A0A433DCR9_9FUNG|nr:kinase-like domain-containing protein [Jimgerdemannia flammicorona]